MESWHSKDLYPHLSNFAAPPQMQLYAKSV